MEEWKEYKFGKVAVFSQGIQVGVEKQIETCKEGYVRFIRIVDYTKGTDAPRYILYPGARYMVDETDIVMMRYGTPGKVARGYSGAIANNMFKITVNEDFLNKDYSFYYLSQDSVYRTLVASNSSSTMPAINFKIIEGLDISAPSISEQMRIVKILKSLDDKIEVNRKINENLEQQAQALFKSWFVDFEPFKNGEFVESELGMIPKGWRVVELSNLAEISKVSINPFKHPRTVFEHYSIPSYDNGMKPEIQLGEDIKSNKFVIENKMILFSKLNPRIKRVWYVDNLGVTPVCSTEFVPYKAIGESKSSFLYGLINSQKFYDFVMSMVNGATGSHQRFHPEESLKYKVAYNEEYCERYSAIITPVINQILVIRDESRRLAELRDTLLPKLMSGKLKVN